MRRNRPLVIFLSLIALVVVLAGLSIYFYQRYHRLEVNPKNASENETKALVAQIGKIMYLPTDETPTVATVSDPDKLKGQVFFEDAKKGYKVLIYTNAKKAILYDPAAGKIVNVAPINIGQNTPGTTTEKSAGQ